MNENDKKIMEELLKSMEQVLAFFDENSLLHFKGDAKLFAQYSEKNVLPLLDNFMKLNRSDLKFATCTLGACCMRYAVQCMRQALGLDNALDQFHALQGDHRHDQ